MLVIGRSSLTCSAPLETHGVAAAYMQVCRPAAAQGLGSSTSANAASATLSARTSTSGLQNTCLAWSARPRCSLLLNDVHKPGMRAPPTECLSCAAVQVVGTLLPGPAEALGLSTDVIVSAGSGDNACSALGVGAVSHGITSLLGC